MRRALLISALVLCLPPNLAHAQTGGAPAPTVSGGTEYGTPLKPVAKTPRKRVLPPVATQFSLTPANVLPGTPLTFSWRVDGGRGKAVRVRVALVKEGTRLVIRNLRYGWMPTGKVVSQTWTPQAGELPPGAYTARIHAVDRAGRALRRTATASGRTPIEILVPPAPVANGVFPVQGPFGWGGDDARFGDDRGTHFHQGQDLTAASGTPLVSPVAGSVFWVDFQAGGAGHYVVIRGADGRDYVFMHLLEGSIVLKKGDLVTAAQQFAAVGSTGRSTGPHLHFEIWPNGWYSSKESKPIDPRPELEAWAVAGGLAPPPAPAK